MKTSTLSITGMHCAACVARIERVTSRMDGVESAAVNLITGRGEFIYDPSKIRETDLIARIEKLGFGASATMDPEEAERREEKKRRHLLLVAGLLWAPMMIGMIGEMAGLWPMLPAWLQFLLAAVSQFGPGMLYYRGARSAIRSGALTMDVLVALGTSVAFFYSAWMYLAGYHHLYFETSAGLIFFILFGKWMEGAAKRKTGAAIRELMKLSPETARVWDGETFVEKPAKYIMEGDMLLVAGGDRVPADGVILKGDATLDESMVTGESLPVEKHAGDPVIGATVNGLTSFTMKAERVGADSMLGRIIRTVESAQNSKAPVQRFADRIAGIFVPVVIGIALVTGIVWFFLEGTAEAALMHAAAVLVIACPCALGLATPTAIMVGSGIAAQKGILFRTAPDLENFASVKTIVFDKTGTLTEGKLSVSHAVYSEGNEETARSLLRAIEAESSHPIARALYAFSETAAPVTLTDTETVPGLGMRAVYENKPVLLGQKKFLKTAGISVSEISANAWEDEGASVSYLAWGGNILAAFAVSDTIRENAAAVASAFTKEGVTPWLVTGDNPRAAGAVAAAVGISHVRAGVLPEDKAAIVSEIREGNGPVAMTGDGINDAPALAVADIGIAMGGGTDAAIESAGVVLLSGDIAAALEAYRISRRTMTNIRENLFWALIYNVIGIPLAACGFLSPMLAGAAMATSSVSVVLNALRMRLKK